MSTIERELTLAKRFYRRAQKERDNREMRRQAREIDHLQRRFIQIQGRAN